MANILLVIAGPKKSALRAASRHGIPARFAKRLAPNETIATTSCKMHRKVGQWFGPKGETIKPGRGYPPGTLLWYNSRGCDSVGELGRARRKPRRRRRR